MIIHFHYDIKIHLCHPRQPPEAQMPTIVLLPILRKKCDLTQQQLAQLSDRSQQLIGKLEQGKAKGIGFETLSLLCKATGAQIGDILVYISDDPNRVDETLTHLSQQLDCPAEEIFPYLPEDLKRAYRRLISIS